MVVLIKNSERRLTGVHSTVFFPSIHWRVGEKGYFKQKCLIRHLANQKNRHRSLKKKVTEMNETVKEESCWNGKRTIVIRDAEITSGSSLHSHKKRSNTQKMHILQIYILTITHAIKRMQTLLIPPPLFSNFIYISFTDLKENSFSPR